MLRATCNLAMVLSLLLGIGGVSTVQATTMTAGWEDDISVLPHHGDVGHPGSPSTHYFLETSDDHHFNWAGGLGLTPQPVTIKYDFRPQSGFPNLITPAEKALALTALTGWAAAVIEH